MLYVNPDDEEENREVGETDTQIAIPDEQSFLVKTLLDYEKPHYLTQFTIVGCPVGLEILNKYEHLVINRRLMNHIDLDTEKRLLAYSQFDIKNSRGMHLYIALETVARPTLRWIRDARLFEVNFFDFHCRKIFTVKRQFSFGYLFAQYCCLFCTVGFKGFGNSADILLPDGTKIGAIKQKLSFSSVILNIYDKTGKIIMVVNGIIGDGILDVTIPDEDEPMAMIETLMSSIEAFDFYRVSLPQYSSPYGITFFKNFVAPEEKALLLGAVILLDYIILNQISDYPHLAELIPDDFEDPRRPTEKMVKCDSKELVLMSEPLRRHRSGNDAIERRKDCFKWCTRLICVFCYLGIRRNAVRFIFLVIVLTIGIPLTFSILKKIGKTDYT